MVHMISREAKLPFEIVMLIIAAVIILITGAMLFPVYSGTLPYYENGLYGLLLIIFALQTITLGRTPFGDTPRSRLLLVVGLLIAIIGMVTSLIPISISFSRVLLFLCLGPGGLLLFLQMLFIKDKLKSWAKYGGIFLHLIFACSAVYILSMVIALLLWKQNLLTTPMTAVVILFFGEIWGDFSTSDLCMQRGLYFVYGHRAAPLEAESVDNANDSGCDFIFWHSSILPRYCARKDK